MTDCCSYICATVELAAKFGISLVSCDTIIIIPYLYNYPHHQ